MLIGRYLKKKVRLVVLEKSADVVDEKNVVIGRPGYRGSITDIGKSADAVKENSLLIGRPVNHGTIRNIRKSENAVALRFAQRLLRNSER